MLMRELSKPGVPRVWQIYVDGTVVVENSDNGSSTHWGQANLKDGMKVFRETLEAQLKKGWAETDRSISRRVFENIDPAPGKFWIIWLNDTSVDIQFGKITKHYWTNYSGQTKSKEFATRDKALLAYEQMIAEKLTDGYEEIHQRDTAYSHLGNELAAKKRDTPKVVRKTREIPAAENLARMLEEAPKASVNTDVTHRIDLDPEDWFWAVWKPRTPVPRPEPEPFDRDACLRRAGRFAKYQGGPTIDALQIPQSMTAEEARFWFEMLLAIDSDHPPKKAAEEITRRKPDAPLDQAKITSKLKRWKGYMGNVPPVLRCLVALLPLKDVIQVYMDFLSSTYWSGTMSFYADALTQTVLIHLSDSEIKEVRKVVLANFDPDWQPTSRHSYLPLPVLLAARLGCQREIARIVQSWPDDTYRTGGKLGYYPEPTLLFGLGNPKLIEAEVRRLRMPFHYQGPKLLRGFLATTETQALDVARDHILEITNKDHCEEMLAILAKMKAPEAAVHLLELSLSAKNPKIARDWLQTEVGNAITGLIPVAAGTGKLALAAVEYLREQRRNGHAGLIESALNSVSTEIAQKIKSQVLDVREKVYPPHTAETTPDWLAKGVAHAATKTPLPGAAFVQVAKLPVVVVDGHRLNPQQIAAVLLALQHAEFSAPPDLLAGLRQHAVSDTLDAFAWAVFDQWIAEGGPPKHKWAMRTLGFLGSDSLALKLTPLIRAWPGESQHPRAVLGLECLRAIGSDTALMQLNGIAVKLKFKALQNKAREFMEAIATQKGLTQSQLEDRIVPDCDLDERGRREFDFGPRQFRFVLGPDMKPLLKDADGKVKTDLPKPGAKDDPAKAEQAVADWKLMKKQIKEVATIQAQRLEQAMVTGRRWTPADFETLIVRHPLMTNLARLVLWGGFDKAGKLIATFRVTEDQTFADAKDNGCKLTGIDSIGLLHPLQLSDDQKAVWGEIFSNYEIVPPFPQLGRPVRAFEPGEIKSNAVTRFEDIKIPAATIVFGLEKLGWTRGLAMDNGHVSGHSKYFPSADVSAVVILEEGFSVGYIQGWEDQEIADVYFVPGQYRVTWGRDLRGADKTIPLRKVDPVIASETLGDLSGLAAKGK